MRQFGIEVERLESGVAVLALHGELDLAHVYNFERELHSVERAEPRCIVIDLRGLDFIDSLGVRGLLAARRRAGRARRRLLVVRGSPAIQRVLTLVGLEDAFETVSEVPTECHDAAVTKPV
jgi:anti-anti-sigma factor